jgi:hypothetical protein
MYTCIYIYALHTWSRRNCSQTNHIDEMGNCELCMQLNQLIQGLPPILNGHSNQASEDSSRCFGDSSNEPSSLAQITEDCNVVWTLCNVSHSILHAQKSGFRKGSMVVSRWQSYMLDPDL